jgi:hypothetical protein
VVLRRIVKCRKSVVERSQTCTALQRVATQAAHVIALLLGFHVLARGPEFRIRPLPYAHVLKFRDISPTTSMSRQVSFRMHLASLKSLYQFAEKHKHW